MLEEIGELLGSLGRGAVLGVVGLICTLSPTKAAEWLGPARVPDGDTVVVTGVRLRLISIDAPEGEQTCAKQDGSLYNCGLEATQALSRLVGAKDVRCTGDKQDRYGRPLVLCHSGNVNLNAEIVRQGWAVTYLGNDYAREEAEAREAKRGMWAGTFQRPSDWRRDARR